MTASLAGERPGWWQNAEPELHEAIEGFPRKLRQKIQEDPTKVIRRKNPFLLRVRAGNSATELASQMVNAYLSSSEETIFGNVLEELALAVCKYARNGQKSASEGIDMEYTDDNGSRTLVQVKSGENWGNASQRKALLDSFNKARTILRQGSRMQVRCIEGCCYGRSRTQDKGNYERLVGDDFWMEISGWKETGYAVLELLGSHAENGLLSLREEACGNILTFFREHGIVHGDTVIWDRFLRLVMQSTSKSGVLEASH